MIAAAAQVWVGCSGGSPGGTRPEPSDGLEAGAEAGGGKGEANPGGASDGGSPDLRAGAPSDGGEKGEEDGGQKGGAAGEQSGQSEAGVSGTSIDDFVPAPHAPFPLVSRHGGPLLQNVELVPVYFGEDPLRGELERFNTWIVTSDYWKLTGAEYGVQAGTRLPAVQFESMAGASLSETQIATWINARVADGQLPKPSANTLYALFYQAGTTITFGATTSCKEFGALHSSTSLANQVFTGEVPFAVIPRCSYTPGDELMIATDVASHEYMEAATDPLPRSAATWFMANRTGPLEAWGKISGPEVADLCLNQSYDLIDGFYVNDIWSNKAAQAGNNPCQPSDPKHPFFSVSADETIYHAQPGTTLTIHARAWSNMPAPDWELGVNWGWVPDSDFDGQAVLSTTTVNNGDELTATVTIPANPPMVGGRSVYSFSIDSIDPINPNFSHPWPFLVIVP